MALAGRLGGFGMESGGYSDSAPANSVWVGHGFSRLGSVDLAWNRLATGIWKVIPSQRIMALLQSAQKGVGTFGSVDLASSCSLHGSWIWRPSLVFGDVLL